MKSVSEIKRSLQRNLLAAKSQSERAFAVGKAMRFALEFSGVPVIDAQFVEGAKDLILHVETSTRHDMASVHGVLKLVYSDLKPQVGPEDDDQGVSCTGDSFVSCFVFAEN